MKQLLLCLFIVVSTGLYSQRNRAPKMAPILVKGYMVNFKGDTVYGEIQRNPADQLDFYKEFYFRTGTRKAKLFNASRVQYYGFEGRNFVRMNYDNQKLFVERLTEGRLKLYEYQFHARVDGVEDIESAYFIRDQFSIVENNVPEKISKKFYKRALKPYLKTEQPSIWENLDKFNFDKDKLVEAIEEFNRHY